MTPAEKFIARYQVIALPYADEIVAGLRDGSAQITHVPETFPLTNADELLRIYELRAKHASRFATEFASRLSRDIEAFCRGLREKKDTACRAWGIERQPYFIYWIWEWASDQSLVGVIKSVDNRKLTDTDRMTFWGKKKDA